MGNSSSSPDDIITQIRNSVNTLINTKKSELDGYINDSVSGFKTNITKASGDSLTLFSGGLTSKLDFFEKGVQEPLQI